ncbi:uncharacterized protein LOC129216458 [Uloborus diversus]|uniref:uncharacterized protein LOC129216458 n=1 Tax=Uloborus diversus TaxID=327109 RepID=UPI0024094A1D|nr:uncharacterized protein LOC129216458 [Uloborus diversus]
MKANVLGVREKEILNDFSNSIQFSNGRYCVELPWKPGMKEKLADNKENAVRRFQVLIKRFGNSPPFFETYKGVIDSYLGEGIVAVPSLDRLSSNQEFYLPHHAVIRDEKPTTRLRIVFDGSAHEDGQFSLNECLFKGLNLYPSLFELLLKFRQSKIAFTADIKQAFLQIEIRFGQRFY